MAYTINHILIAATALLALSMAVVARPEKEDCASMSKALQLEGLNDDDGIVCTNILPRPDNCTPSVEEAEWALDLLSDSEVGCKAGEYPNCNTPVSTPTIAIKVCGNTNQPSVSRCKEVADALRPVLKKCQQWGFVVGSVKQGDLTFAISPPPSISRLCLMTEK